MTWPSRAPRFELPRGHELYPSLLSQSSDPPDTLFGIGEADALVSGLGVIGARRATPYGLKAAEILAGWAARAGYTVISGAAIGCDQAAHRATLSNAGITVAVLAGGADVAYPRNASGLLSDIAECGAVVSEYPWGTQPQRWMFRRRNRIIAGLSAALLVLEAGLGSGTFSTADHALDAGREVLAVPGSIFAPECAGTNRLVRQGATPITDASELRDALVPVFGPSRTDLPGGPDSLLRRTEDSLLRALNADPMRPDDLARALGLDIVEVSRRLGALETTGSVKRWRDGRYGPG